MPVAVTESALDVVTFVPPPPSVPVTTGPMVVVYDPTDYSTVLAYMPEATDVLFHSILNEIGSGSFNMPETAEVLVDYPTALDTLNPARVYIDGIEVWWGLLSSVSDLIDGEGHTLKTVAMKQGKYWMSRAVLYPYDWPTNTAPVWEFTDKTPGYIAKQLIDDAIARGSFPGLSYDFTVTVDSNGTAWPGTMTIDFPPLAKYTTILDTLRNYGCEWELDSDLTLHLYVTGGRADDNTAEDDGPRFVLGDNVFGITSVSDFAEPGTVVLLQGKDGFYVQREDTPGVTAYGRWEIPVSHSEVTNTGTASEFADTALAQTAGPLAQLSLNLRRSENLAPFIHVKVGDWVTLWAPSKGISGDKYRIVSMAGGGDPMATTYMVDLNSSRIEALYAQYAISNRLKQNLAAARVSTADGLAAHSHVVVGDIEGRTSGDGDYATAIANAAVTSIKLAANLQSDNYVFGTSGWYIDRNLGDAEFNDVVIRGTITAGAGSTVDWSYIQNVSIVNADIVSLSASKITSGTMTSREIVLAGSGFIESENYAPGTTGWHIHSDGFAEFGDVEIRGQLTALAGSSLDWAYIDNVSIVNADIVSVAASKITAGTITSQNIVIGGTGIIKSANYSVGTAGWQIEADGDAFFNDVEVRGKIIAGTGSSMDWSYIANVSVTNADIVSLAVSKLTAGTIASKNILVSGTGYIRSSNYDANNGFTIGSDGSAVFNDVTVRGTIYATGGEIGTLSVTGTLTMGTGGVFRTASSGRRVEINKTFFQGVKLYWSGSETYPFEISIDGTGIARIRGYSSAASWPIIEFFPDGTLWLQPATGSYIKFHGATNDYIVSSIQYQSVWGNATKPGIAFSSDTGTGMYRYTGGQIGFAGSGSALGRMTSSGILMNGGLFQSGGATATLASSDGNDKLDIENAGYLRFYAAGVEKFRAQDGKVIGSIGTGAGLIFTNLANGNTGFGMIGSGTSSFAYIYANGTVQLALGQTAGQHYWNGLGDIGNQLSVRWNSGTNQFGYYSSSAELKERIGDLSETGTIIDMLRPREYRRKAWDKLVHPMGDLELEPIQAQGEEWGFVSEELNAIDVHLTVGGDDPGEAPDEYALLAVLTKEIQSLRRRVALLEAA